MLAILNRFSVTRVNLGDEGKYLCCPGWEPIYIGLRLARVLIASKSVLVVSKTMFAGTSLSVRGNVTKQSSSGSLLEGRNLFSPWTRSMQTKLFSRCYLKG